MTYDSWYQAHGKKHKAVMDKLTHLSDDEVIAYFRFDNMVKNEPDFCALYTENKKCHKCERLGGSFFQRNLKLKDGKSKFMEVSLSLPEKWWW